MGIGKDHPFGGQTVHVRRSGLGIALQHTSPVIQIVDGDEQHIQAFRLTAMRLRLP